MTSLNSDEKQWLDARLKRLDNYCLLKVGIFAILSVFCLADFVNANALMRWLYAVCWLVFIFYVYFLIDTKKFTAKLRNLIKNG